MIERIEVLIKEHEKLSAVQDTKLWERGWEVMSKKLDGLIDDPEIEKMGQDGLIKFLELTRESSWDIPSALMSLCSHLDEDEYYYMHRAPADVEPRWRYLYPASEKWEPADKHFMEVHGWDLKDARIDWSFDT